MGGFYPNRSGNYRPSHNRNYGNFDSMGHPKHFAGSGGGGYQQQGSAGMSAPFPSHYNRQVDFFTCNLINQSHFIHQIAEDSEGTF